MVRLDRWTVGLWLDRSYIGLYYRSSKTDEDRSRHFSQFNLSEAQA